MQYAFVALAIALFGYAVADSVSGSGGQSNAPASFPVSNLTFGGANSGTTLPQAGLNTNSAQAEFPASLLLCRNTACAGCTSFNLSAIPQNICFSPDPLFSFLSVAVVQPSNQGLPFGVEVGPANCGEVAAIPRVNECFDVRGAVFEAFEIDT